MIIGYVEHSAAYRFLVLKSDALNSNTIIETKNVEYFEHIFYYVIKSLMHLMKEKMNLPLILGNWEGVKGLEKNVLLWKWFSTFFVENKPSNYFEAISSSDAKFWKETIKIWTWFNCEK